MMNNVPVSQVWIDEEEWLKEINNGWLENELHKAFKIDESVPEDEVWFDYIDGDGKPHRIRLTNFTIGDEK
jgi:hypothetical protein